MYCNFGYGLLGYVLARQAGGSYEQLISTQITGPLHLDDTVVTLSPEQRKRLIQGYDSDFNRASTWDFGCPGWRGRTQVHRRRPAHPSRRESAPREIRRECAARHAASNPAAGIAIDHQLRADADPGDKIALVFP